MLSDLGSLSSVVLSGLVSWPMLSSHDDLLMLCVIALELNLKLLFSLLFVPMALVENVFNCLEHEPDGNPCAI
jgi:hypothetical protein